MITSVVSGPRKPNSGVGYEEEKVRGVGGGKQKSQEAPAPVLTAPPHPFCT